MRMTRRSFGLGLAAAAVAAPAAPAIIDAAPAITPFDPIAFGEITGARAFANLIHAQNIAVGTIQRSEIIGEVLTVDVQFATAEIAKAFRVPASYLMPPPWLR